MLHILLRFVVHICVKCYIGAYFLSLYRRYFLTACDVPSLEDKFNVDQYSDLVTVTKPVIYISIGEMINTHTVSSVVPQCLCTSFENGPHYGRSSAVTDCFFI